MSPGKSPAKGAASFLNAMRRRLFDLERFFVAFSLAATLLISWALYTAVIQRPINSKPSELYWMVTQMQLTLNRLEMDAWRYRAGQISQEDVDKSYAIAASKYRMYSHPSISQNALSKLAGFPELSQELNVLFQRPPRQWSQQDALQLSKDLAKLRPMLAEFAGEARHQENSDLVNQIAMLKKHQTMYLLGLVFWLVFLTIFWVVLHRLGELKRQAERQKQLFEREQAAREALVQTELARDTFLATISHEIRSPLQSIQTCVELLEYSIPPETAHYNYLTRLKRSTDHLLTQVRDIMDVAALKNHRLALEPSRTDMKALAEEMEQAHRGNAEAKGLRFFVNCGELPVLWLDSGRLRQIIWNLLTNAIRYTDHGSIRLSIRYQSPLLHIAIEDTGVGIADDIKTQLFRPFARGKNRRPGSSGLGLAIVHELVTLFGGRIQVESEAGVGTCFRLQLPAQPVTAEGASNAVTPPCILLLDDDDQIRESYHALLESKGYKVETLATVPDAIEHVQTEKYDLLLLDLQVGSASGYEVAEAALQSPHNRLTPVVGMTAFRQEFSDSRQTLLFGKLEKPFNFGQLQRYLPSFGQISAANRPEAFPSR
ncbi:hybrid sensor histidine kinase/response regulator [Chromobacterium sp. IIBBL 290-4]|uniref:ATP-binding response regulator n=1 Tax=Chromobacterium sp. IIBBL 290-4 TaxID=2953890 RepID=UPI0020B8A6F8|nr:hybrid sensor histidine kinase/response regulator [Chromobacterium sp. IIBBL 290-4]UTH72880.1 hybrid sensor histidine kinase/response regulator [Chromobacterium sp. IIBBL 290-4]